VTRPYGGTLTAEAVRHRILRAFFNEEMKVVKHAAIGVRKHKKKGGQRKK